MQDLVAGQIDLSCPRPGQTLPQFRTGGIKAFAVLTGEALVRGARRADHRRGRRAGRALPVLARPVGAEGHAEGRDRQAQRRGRRTASPIANVRKRLTDLGHEIAPRRAADAGGARRLSQGGDREVVADHQGGEHQGRAALTAGSAHSGRRHQRRSGIRDKSVLDWNSVRAIGRRGMTARRSLQRLLKMHHRRTSHDVRR